MHGEARRPWQTKMPPVGQLRIGGTYQARNGHSIKIVKYHEGKAAPFLGDNGCSYYPDGRYSPDDMCFGTLWKEVTESEYLRRSDTAFYFDGNGKCLYIDGTGNVLDHNKDLVWSAHFNQDGLPTGSNPRYQSPLVKAAAYCSKATTILGEPQREKFDPVYREWRPVEGSESIRVMYYIQQLCELTAGEKAAIKEIVRSWDHLARIAMVPLPVKSKAELPQLLDTERHKEINAKLLWLLQQDMPDKNYLPRAVDPDFTYGYGFGGDITAIHKRYIQCESAGVRITEVILRGGPGMKPRKYGDTGCGCGQEIVETPIVGVEGLRKNAAPHRNREDLWKIFEPFWTKVWTQRRMWRLTKGLPEETITW